MLRDEVNCGGENDKTQTILRDMVSGTAFHTHSHKDVTL